MMHSYSPSSRQLAVPGIGFPQNISVDRDVLDLAAVRDWSDDRFDAPSQPVDRIAGRPSRRRWFAADGEKCCAERAARSSLMCYR